MRNFSHLLLGCVNMGYAVMEFGQLSAVPTISSTYKITGNSLKLVDVVASALRAYFQIGICILISTVKTAIAVVVY